MTLEVQREETQIPRGENWRYLPVLPPVLAAFHFDYGTGFLWGMVDFLLLKKKGREAGCEMGG